MATGLPPASLSPRGGEARREVAVHQPPRPPADRRLAEVRRIDQTYAPPAYDDLAGWEARRAALRLQIRCAGGLEPEPSRAPLEARVMGRQECGDFTVENVAFQSRPGLYVTGNLYRPVGATGPRPALLCPHGHSRGGRLEHSENSSTPARCISFARQGYLAFAYDMLGYHDARQVPHRWGDERDWQWGLSVLGLQLWNSVRALDFLLGLPDVDPERVGCVGESGGATQTLLLAAVDDRVGYLAPVVMVSAHYQGGCLCENAPNLRLDTSNVEIAAMAAPRPMVLVSASGDWTRNTPTVEFPAIRRIYALYGAADRLSEQQIDAPHNFNRASREAVYRFFSHWFRGTPADQPLPEQPLAPPADERLRVFPRALPDDALDLAGLRRAARDEARRQLDLTRPRDAAGLERFRAAYGPAYRCSLDTRPARAGELTIERLGDSAFGGHRAERLLLCRPEGGEHLPALFFAGEQGRPVLLLHEEGKAAYFGEAAGAVVAGPLLGGLLERGRPVLLVDAFLTGDYHTITARSGRDQSSPHFPTFNRCDTALRVQDVATAVAAARQLAGAGTVDLVGLGDAGLWCLLARPLADGVARLLADTAGFDPESDDDALCRLYVADLRRLGGLETALLLATPAAVRLFAAPWPALAERLAALYAALGRPGDFAVEAAPPDDRRLLTLLAMPD